MFRLNVIERTLELRRRRRQLRHPKPSSLAVQLISLILWHCILINHLSPIPTATANTINHNRHHHCQLHAPPAVGESLVEDGGAAQASTTSSSPSPAQEAPDFEEPIGNHTVPMGRDAQLSCKIRNLGNFRTAWLRVEDKGILSIHNNVITRNYRFGLLNDENERNFILTIKNVQPSDKGGYMCQINSVPMRYAVGYLDVLTAPVFDEALSPGPLEGPAARTQPVASSSSSLSSAGNADGLLDDSIAAANTAATTNSSQVTVREGTSATLTCRASGHPSPSITWRREDGRPILLNGIESSLDASPIEIRDTTALTFSAVHRTNSGAYLCIASNGVQPSASKRQLLDVQFGPIITLPQAEVPGQVGQSEARLECLAELNPLGSYHWIKLATTTTNTDRRPMVTNQEDDLWLIEHDELLQSDKIDIVMRQMNSEKVQMILTLRNIEKQDFSWYKCVARNSLGLQSNFVRFYESSAPAPVSPSSSFSFNSMFRSALGHQPARQADGQPNDEQDRPGRAHTRSSWIQRSAGPGAGYGAGSPNSRARLESSVSAASGAPAPVARLPTPTGRSPLSIVTYLMSPHCHPVAIVSLLPYLVGMMLAIAHQRPTHVSRPTQAAWV